MDFDKLCSGTVLCQACQFALDEQSIELAVVVGKDKRQRMRNYSHFVVAGKWSPLGKDHKAEMRELIFGGGWSVAAIAVSGQKHILFRAAMGVVQLEEQQVHDIRPLPVLLDLMDDALATFSKSEIESGEYRSDRVLQIGPSAFRAFERQMQSWRGHPTFALALFLAQKREVEADGGGATEATLSERRAGSMERHAGRLQDPLPGFDMASV